MSGTNESTHRDPYQKFLEDKHRKFETPNEIVDLVVEKATGSLPTNRKRIVEGEVNEVWDVTTKSFDKVIVRISRLSSSSFEAEEKAIRLASMAGVPTPKILLIDKVVSEHENFTFCIEEKVEGEPLRKLMTTLNKNTLKSIISEAGNLLFKINDITLDSFGSLNRTDSYKTWGDYIFNLEEKRIRIIKAGKIIGIRSDLIDRAFRELRKNEHLFRIKEPKLLHGDFSPKHLLIKDNHIVGIIDFENAKGGDPIRDFAWINYFYYNSFPLQWLKEGYKNKALFDKDFDTKMKLYRLHLGLDFIDYYQSQRNKPGMSYTKDRFISELEGF